MPRELYWFSAHLPGSLSARVVRSRKVSPPRFIIRMHHAVLAMSVAGICIWHGSSSAFMRMSSRVTGKPSLRFSPTYLVTHCWNSWKRPFLGPPHAFRDEFAYLSCLSFVAIYELYPSLYQTSFPPHIGRGLSMVNHHQLQICVVGSPRGHRKMGTRSSAFSAVVTTRSKLTVMFQNF
jgi:hypothetical protein